MRDGRHSDADDVNTRSGSRVCVFSTMLKIDIERLEGAPLLVMAGRLDGRGASIFDAAIASVDLGSVGSVLLDDRSTA